MFDLVFWFFYSIHKTNIQVKNDIQFFCLLFLIPFLIFSILTLLKKF